MEELNLEWEAKHFLASHHSRQHYDPNLARFREDASRAGFALDEEVLKLAEPFDKVLWHNLNERDRRTLRNIFCKALGLNPVFEISNEPVKNNWLSKILRFFR